MAELRNKSVIGKQRMRAVSNHQAGRNLAGVGGQFGALMAEQGIHRRNTEFKQGKQRQVKFGHVAQLHQRRITPFQATPL